MLDESLQKGRNEPMKSGRDLILATKPFASDNPVRSWFYLLSTALFLILVTGLTLSPLPLPFRMLGSVLMGLLILRLFVIYHDQQHHAILAHSPTAEFLMRVYGILTLSPSSVWRSSHNYHHKHNSKLRSAHIGSFPIMTKERFLKSSRTQQRYYLFMRHPLTILFGYFFIFIYGMCLKPFFSYPRQHIEGLVALIIHGVWAAALTYYMGWQTLILALVFPYFLAYAIGSYLFYAQHNFPQVLFGDHAGWTYEKAALESSSYMKCGPVMRWFMANIGYHHVHHLNAKIPFYRLPEALEKIPELQTAKTTSLHPLEIYRCLRLKVWDVEKQEMVPLSALR